jgi:cell division protein FtsA
VISNSRIIGAVDIGTHKVTVLIGEIAGGRHLNIIGMGQCSSHGVLKGAVVDFKAASDSTHAALEAAERKAGTSIEGIYLAMTGSHLDGFYHEGAVNVNAADNLVRPADIELVNRLAKAKELPENRTVIHYLRRPYRLDGQQVGNPETLCGRKLEAGYWIAHGDTGKVSDSIHIINGFNLKVDEIILASVATGTMVTTPEERQHGALVIDIGRGTTDFVLYRDGCPWVTGVVPVGGDHLTNDLSLGLRLTTAQAEAIKLRHGSAVVTCRDRSEKVWLNGDFAIGDRQFPRQAIEQITAARFEETLQIVKRKLGVLLEPERLGAGVVLAGGSCKMPGVEDAATAVFGTTARRGENPPSLADELRDTTCSTALGLLYYGVNPSGPGTAARPPTRTLRHRLRRIFAST